MRKNGRNFQVPREDLYKLINSTIGRRTYFQRKELKLLIEEELGIYFHYKMFYRYTKEGLLPEENEAGFHRGHVFSWVTIGILKEYFSSSKVVKIMKEYHLSENGELFVQEFNNIYQASFSSEKFEGSFEFAVLEALKHLKDPNCTDENSPTVKTSVPLKVLNVDNEIEKIKIRVKTTINQLEKFYNELSSIGG